MDTIIIAAKEDTFNDVFVQQRCWYPMRLGDEKLGLLQWIAAYRVSPVSAITHVARICGIERYMDTGRYKILFDPPTELEMPVQSSSGAIQGHRYTELQRLLKARTVDDLKPWA